MQANTSTILGYKLTPKELFYLCAVAYCGATDALWGTNSRSLVAMGYQYDRATCHKLHIRYHRLQLWPRLASILDFKPLMQIVIRALQLALAEGHLPMVDGAEALIRLLIRNVCGQKLIQQTLIKKKSTNL